MPKSRRNKEKKSNRLRKQLNKTRRHGQTRMTNRDMKVFIKDLRRVKTEARGINADQSGSLQQVREDSPNDAQHKGVGRIILP